jgi:hypothetical protein
MIYRTAERMDFAPRLCLALTAAYACFSPNGRDKATQIILRRTSKLSLQTSAISAPIRNRQSAI